MTAMPARMREYQYLVTKLVRVMMLLSEKRSSRSVKRGPRGSTLNKEMMIIFTTTTNTAKVIERCSDLDCQGRSWNILEGYDKSLNVIGQSMKSTGLSKVYGMPR